MPLSLSLGNSGIYPQGQGHGGICAIVNSSNPYDEEGMGDGACVLNQGMKDGLPFSAERHAGLDQIGQTKLSSSPPSAGSAVHPPSPPSGVRGTLGFPLFFATWGLPGGFFSQEGGEDWILHAH
eukprot:1156546-Pelagomonas_calceolata.AAC.3